jgi:hypothetical protein
VKIHNLYCDSQGESHFRDVDVVWSHHGRDGMVSMPLVATALTFRVTDGDYHNDWHTSPRRQYVINLDGPVEITASDGEVRLIGAGEVLLLEDVHGKGHAGRSVDGKFRHSVVVAVA